MDVCNLPQNALRKKINWWMNRGMDKWIDMWQRKYCKMVSKPDHYIYCLQETHLKPKDTYRLKVKGWKQAFHANGDQKKVGVAILISDKIDFKTKAVKRDKEGHDIVIRGSIQEKDIIINIYAPNIGAPQYARQMLTSMKGEINSNTIIVGDFNTYG